MPTPGPLELVIILVIALLILGPGKLPDVGAALGKSIREFRKASTDVQDAVKVDTTPAPGRRRPPRPPTTAAQAPSRRRRAGRPPRPTRRRSRSGRRPSAPASEPTAGSN